MAVFVVLQLSSCQLVNCFTKTYWVMILSSKLYIMSCLSEVLYHTDYTPRLVVHFKQKEFFNTNKCTVPLLRNSLLISRYLFRLNCHHQVDNTCITKACSNKIVLQCLHMSKVQIILKINGVDYKLLLNNGSFLFTIVFLPVGFCSRNMYCVMIGIGSCTVTCMLCLYCVKCTTRRGVYSVW
jgi:hypothetical protein